MLLEAKAKSLLPQFPLTQLLLISTLFEHYLLICFVSSEKTRISFIAVPPELAVSRT